MIAKVLLLIAAAAPPTISNLESDTTIVVTGSEEETRGTLERRAKAIAEPHNGHFSRYESPVCMGITGLALEASEAVVGRFRKTAAQAGIALAAPGCKANLLVLISPDPKAVLAEIKRSKPAYLAPLSGRERNKLLSSDGPIWTWRNNVPQRADGGPVQRISAIETEEKISSVSKDAFIVENVGMSRLSSPIRYTMDQTFVLIDANSLVGIDSHQLGDFVALVGLTAVDFGQVKRYDRNSILSLFSQSAPPSEASDIDRAYLKAFYAGSGGLTAQQKLADLSRRMADDLLDEQ